MRIESWDGEEKQQLKVWIFKRDEEETHEFTVQSIPTVTEVKQKLTEKLNIQMM